MSERIEYVDLKLIHPNRLNPRLEINVMALNELADSIKQVGIIEPLIIRPKDGEYEVVVGERRYRAAQQAGLSKIPAIIRDYGDDEVIELNLIENIQREDLSAVEKGSICERLLDKYPEKYPTTHSLAQKLGVHETTVKTWISVVLEVPKEIQRLIVPVERPKPVPKGKITYDAALQISRQIQEPERQMEIAQKLSEEPVSTYLARRIIREVAKEPERPVEEIVQKVIEEPYELPFRLSHMQPILDGIKTQTSRRGIPDPKIKEGAVIHAAVWEPHFADLLVTKIERKKLGDFTEEDARREGGYTLEEFKQVWKDLHGEWNQDETVYIIHFREAK